ncbi:MAG: hypothetical protein KC549_01425 [Myxococcales bacterium]|nr:hypothetical protein [Myxococcales bacterium]
MNHATLAQLGRFLLGLGLIPDRPPPADDPLRARRQAVLAASNAARIYLPRLTPLTAELATFPGTFVDDADLTRQIAEADREHDAYGAALYHLTEAIRRLPATPEHAPAQAAAAAIRARFIPSLGDLTRRHSREADAALARLPHLDAHRAQLDQLPVPGGTAWTWTQRYLDAGARLDTLLDQRDLQRAAGTTDRRRLPALRIEILTLLHRFRAALADEAGVDPIPANAETLIFGPLDEHTARA